MTSFWGDSWCGVSPLKDMFRDIYNICNEQDITLASDAGMDWNFTFRRWMTPDLAIQKQGLVALLSQIHRNEEKDRHF
jgi:hypothetical protein